MHHIRVPWKLQDELSDLMRFIDRKPHEILLQLRGTEMDHRFGVIKRWTWVVPAILPWNAPRQKKTVKPKSNKKRYK